MGCILLSMNRSDSLPLEASSGDLDDRLPQGIIRSVRQQVKVADKIGTMDCGARRLGILCRRHPRWPTPRLTLKRQPVRRLHVDGTHRHARHGTHRCNRLGLRANCPRNKSSRCLRAFRHLRFERELAPRVGTQARSGKATARIRGIGRHWRNSLNPGRAREWHRTARVEFQHSSSLASNTEG
jgi:hypothetical protein